MLFTEELPADKVRQAGGVPGCLQYICYSTRKPAGTQ
jgi:hypothetical protein